MRISRVAAAALACLLAPAPALARERAPLPAGFVDETRRGEYEVYDPVPDLRGIYAHGVAAGPVFGELDASDEFCTGSEQERRGLLEKYADTPASEYWFYGTHDEGVLFIKETRLMLLPGERLDCSRVVWISFEIERAYVADGFVHNFLFDEQTVPGLGSYRPDRDAGGYSGSFMRLQGLMARQELPQDRRELRKWRRETIAGVPALCSGASGLVWSSTCYASRGELRGMLLSSGAGDDERSMFSYRVLEVRPGVMLPGAVFEVDRDWGLREGG